MSFAYFQNHQLPWVRTVSKTIGVTFLVYLIVTQIYMGLAIQKAHAFVESDCNFQALRTPNAETLHLRAAKVDDDRATAMNSARDLRVKRGQLELAQIWDELADDEKADAKSERDFASATYSLYLAGCGAAPTPAPDLHYFTAPPR